MALTKTNLTSKINKKDKVVNNNTILSPVAEMPDEIEPESNFKISVSEDNGRKMTYTIAVVDEGLLDLTAYKTPKPWNYFYAKEALGVKTWDMYKYVINIYINIHI